ncbi:MAG: hypothetical protein ACREER_08585 [Alphaproteobacteria bacterium]
MDAEVNLGELAGVLGLTEVTLRKWLTRYPDFPVLARGDHGVAYRFDARAVKGWIDEHRAARDEAAEERQAELAQLQLELTGGQAPDGDRALTAKERKEALEVAYAEAKWRQVKGELVEVAELDRALDELFVVLRVDVMRLPERLRLMAALDREALAEVDTQCRATLDAAEGRIRDRFGRAEAAAA